MTKKLTFLKVLLSAGALAAMVARLIWPDLRFDAVSVGLLILILLPWMSGLFESLEFPGGWKIKFRDLESVSSAFDGTTASLVTTSAVPTFMAVRNLDPALALVGLRIEVEVRLQQLADSSGIDVGRNKSGMGLLRGLQRESILPPKQARALHELLRIGNAAAHGADLPADGEDFAFAEGPAILAWLDERIAA